MKTTSTLALAAIGSLVLSVGAVAADEKSAERVLKANDCAKCHTVSREKDGPPYKKIAEKYKGKADGEQQLLAHLMSEPMVKVDGKDEKHKKIAVDSQAELVNLVQWILTR
jgi:cytochrome c